MRHNWRRGIHRGGEVSSPSGLGNPTPTDPTSLAPLPIFVPPVSRLTCRLSGGKCGTIGGAVSIVGRGHLAQRVGEPNPYGSNFGCSPSNFHASRIPVHMSPLWGFRCLVHAACYKHVAPLGLTAEPNPAAPSTLVRACWGFVYPCNPLNPSNP